MPDPSRQSNPAERPSSNQGDSSAWTLPSPSLPNGGGAIRGIGEKFQTSPATGSGTFSIPIATSPGRSGFGPQLSLSYDSGAGNGPFGFGWSLSTPSITRKTDKGIPRYHDAAESDTFLLSGAEDLVPMPVEGAGNGNPPDADAPIIRRYRPRTEGLFARIERWTSASGDVHWRSVTKDNITTSYGDSAASRIADPDDPTRIFSWLISETWDDRGNRIGYTWAEENDRAVDLGLPSERSRIRGANRYLRSIGYGNRVSRLVQPDIDEAAFQFRVVFHYGEPFLTETEPNPAIALVDQHAQVALRLPIPDEPVWAVRPDPFSSYRSGFEIRTHRRCARVLTFHHMPDELGPDPVLVTSTDFDYADLAYDDPAHPATIDAELTHQGSTRVASFLMRATRSGYVPDPDAAPALGVRAYIRKSFPPVEFTYSKAAIQDEIGEIEAAQLANLPIGVDGSRFQFVDLDGVGIPGILAGDASGWYYKENLGGGAFGPLRQLDGAPSLGSPGDGRMQLLDLAADGQLDAAFIGEPLAGFYERDEHAPQGWQPFRAFSSVPHIDWADPNLRFVDLDGDGHTDVLIADPPAMISYQSLAEEGFAPATRSIQPYDEERGPSLVFADGTQSLYLADMSGDGLNDLVRIRNGEICYWPSLGYGRFGSRVVMDDPPCFDTLDQFSQQRVHLADVDGSGVTDIIYCDGRGARIYFNQSGNRWSAGRSLPQFPPVDSLSSVVTTDLFGNGTACLVWSSPLPGARSLRYIDLMGGTKPHLLVQSANNLGAETRVTYAASTSFMLADKQAGHPWITRLPFPVHVVTSTETIDRISGNRFTASYAYHHGHFDGIEREFCGFAMVEQWDCELAPIIGAAAASNDLPAHNLPPFHTKRWFHTGFHLEGERVSDYFGDLRDPANPSRYFQAGNDLLPDTVLERDWSAEATRQACRALKGSSLRTEVYALDGSEQQGTPYAVTQQNFTIEQLQPPGSNTFGVYFVHPRESVVYHYERNTDDPRVNHDFTLTVDGFGTVRRSLSVTYRRRTAPYPEQDQTHLVLTANRVRNESDEPDWYRVGLPIETRTYEIVRPNRETGRFALEEIDTLLAGLVPDDLDRFPNADTLYHEWDWRAGWDQDADPQQTSLRLIEAVRTRYRPDDFGASAGDAAALLPLGEVQSRALTGEMYTLAFPAELAELVYQRPLDTVPPAANPEALLPDLTGVLLSTGADGGGYVDLDGDGNLWTRTGRVSLHPDPATPEDEAAWATEHFFLPFRAVDPFGNVGQVAYDDALLFPVRATDAVGNTVTVVNDYRTLQPHTVTDANGNVSRVAFDALGMVVGEAVAGKPDQVPSVGDSLDGLVPDLTEQAVLDHLADPTADVPAMLGAATSRTLYDLHAYVRTKANAQPQPVVAYAVSRTRHQSDAIPANEAIWQHAFTWSDGFGREIQKKVIAEPGPVPRRDAHGGIVLGADGAPVYTDDDAPVRWVGSGWTVFNNKGKPIAAFEPFFTNLASYESEAKIGFSSILFYDPMERQVAAAHPNGTWEKVVFDAWTQATWDVNDTAAPHPPSGFTGQLAGDPDVGGIVANWLAAQGDDWKPWYAACMNLPPTDRELAAAKSVESHAATPSVAHLDSLGRPFLTFAHKGFDANDKAQLVPARTVQDIEGNTREVYDGLERLVMRYRTTMLGGAMHQASMEAGERWTLADTTGKPIRAWDSRGHTYRTIYDALRRPTHTWVSGIEPGHELAIERTVYGELHPDAAQCNLRGKVAFHADQSGLSATKITDFKGNTLAATRRLVSERRAAVDWAVLDGVALVDGQLDLAGLDAAAAPLLESELWQSSARFDALNRAIQTVAPHAAGGWNFSQPEFNVAGFLEQLHVWTNQAAAPDTLRDPATASHHPVTATEHDAKGQRLRIAYGNKVTTTYDYDPRTYRLQRMTTTGPGARGFQALTYTYDPAGNITAIDDGAQQTIWFDGEVVKANAAYTYDPLYRLVSATGREHLATVGGDPIPHSYNDFPRTRLPQPGNGQQMENYTETYVYDDAGNMKTMKHQGKAHGWTREFEYREPSQLEPGLFSNRLSHTVLNGVTERFHSDGVAGYDAHGNMLALPQLSALQWSFDDHLHMTQRQKVNDADIDGAECHAEQTWYRYDSGGERSRKTTFITGGTERKDRLYLGGFERFVRTGPNAVTRETLHIFDGANRIALIDIKTSGAPEETIRYQFANHLGTAVAELDGTADVISYEEYSPYGSTVYQAVRSQTEAEKRYRYTNKERDEESGLYYFGARYYLSWLGRWASCDPSGIDDGADSYLFVHCRPIVLVDTDGREGSWFSRARESVRQSSVGRGIAGLGYGTMQALTPGGVLMPTPPGGGQAFEIGQGLGQIAVGAAELFVGTGLMSSGAGLAAGGGTAEVLSLGSATVVAVPATAAGVVVAGVGVAVTAHGGSNILSGAKAIQNSMQSTGSGSQPPKAPETPKNPETPKASEPANPAQPESPAVEPASTALPDSPPPAKKVPNPDGAKGSPKTQQQNKEIGEQLSNTENGYTVTGGGGVAKEKYFPGPEGGNKGSVRVDVTAQKPGDRVHVQTVDTRGKNSSIPDKREMRNAGKILKNDRDAGLFLIPKRK